MTPLLLSPYLPHTSFESLHTPTSSACRQGRVIHVYALHSQEVGKVKNNNKKKKHLNSLTLGRQLKQWLQTLKLTPLDLKNVDLGMTDSFVEPLSRLTPLRVKLIN